jgi:3-oxoacyl-[acyl-carrier protein] reductase
MQPERGRVSELAGKVAVITGASSGIGAALAERLAGMSVRLGLGCRRSRESPIPGAYETTCDVRDFLQVSRLVDTTAERFGRLDILVANAGVGSYHPFLETPMNDIDEMIDTNVRGTVYLLRAGLPHLLAAGGGDVVVIASEAGRRGLPGEAVYSASKFAQVGLTRALDNELREHNIRCSVVCPGGVATNFAMGDGRGRTPESVAAAGMMAAVDIAEIVLFTLSRPRHMRLMETVLRPMSEPSWG